MLLPVIASAEDAIQLVAFLKTRVTGCTINDAKAVIDNKILDPRKISAYNIWKLIIRDGEKIKLSELGKKLSRATPVDYSDVFREILQSNDAYHSALEWIFYRKEMTAVSNVEIARYWYENKKFGMENENENTLKDMAVCFFRVCETASIGKLFIGRRGQATRLEINRDSLGQYIGVSTLSDGKARETSESVESTNAANLFEPDKIVNAQPLQEEQNITKTPLADPVHIFISHGKNMDIVDQIKTLIELADFEYEIAVENETSAIPIPDKVFGAMRRCNAAVICVSADENEKNKDGGYIINQNVLIEIGSAFVLYDKKVILVWDKRLDIPSNLQGLYRCEFTGNELSWGTGIKLMKALNEFKK